MGSKVPVFQKIKLGPLKVPSEPISEKVDNCHDFYLDGLIQYLARWQIQPLTLTISIQPLEVWIWHTKTAIFCFPSNDDFMLSRLTGASIHTAHAMDIS